jgi:chromosome segregation ATPase
MAHPLEQAIQTTVQEHSKMLKEINELRTDLSAAEKREAILQGRIATLDKELDDAKARGDYYQRCNIAILTQLDNIEMFVKDAVRMAGDQVERGNGKEPPKAIAQAEKAIEDAINQG